MFRQRVQQFINDKALFSAKDKVLVALSGGADSVALLRLLLVQGYICECMHCNFHLRGEESDRDEMFVRSLCEKLEVPLHVIHFDTKKYAYENRLSIEMAARELRYSWFEKQCSELNAAVVAVAHHRDDSVETILLNLIRGTGINGLKGINAKNGFVVRPFLQESREAIEDYLKSIGQDYIIDSTNLQDEYMRNKIRLNILPLMKSLNPSIAETLFDMGERLSEVANIYNRDRLSALEQCVYEKQEDSFRVRIDDILSDIAPASLLHEMIWPYGFNAAQEKDVMRSLGNHQSGKRFYSKEWELLRDREELIVQKRKMKEMICELLVEEMEVTPSFVIPRTKDVACIDADKLTHSLQLRHWKIGDKFIPLGMKGQKRISDYLTDRKYSIYDKEKQMVVCDGDNIVWVVNERMDNRYRITEDTRHVLLIRVK